MIRPVRTTRENENGRASITSQIYTIRAAIARSIVAYYGKYVDDESAKNELRKMLIDYDHNLLVSDPRR